MTAPASRRPLAAARRRYDAAPLATAVVLFAVLAAVRVSGAYVVTTLVISFVLTPAVVLVAPRSLLPEIGLRRIASWSSLLEGTWVVVASYAISVGVCVIALGTGRDNWAAGLLAVIEGWVPPSGPVHTPALTALSVLFLGLLVPLAEEVCYRGVLLHAAMTRWGPGTAAVVTSAGWALVHLGDYGLQPWNPLVALGMLPSVFVMGLALTWCRLRTGSVWASTLAQGVANLLLAVWVVTW